METENSKIGTISQQELDEMFRTLERLEKTAEALEKSIDANLRASMQLRRDPFGTGL